MPMVYTIIPDIHIERILRSEPVSRVEVTTLYSEDGIYEIRNKIHKVFSEDVPCEMIMHQGREFRTDLSTRALQERWQIPMPHDAEIASVSIYNVAPNVQLFFEQNHRTRYYFVAKTKDVIDWVDTLY